MLELELFREFQRAELRSQRATRAREHADARPPRRQLSRDPELLRHACVRFVAPIGEVAFPTSSSLGFVLQASALAQPVGGNSGGDVTFAPIGRAGLMRELCTSPA